MTDKSHLSEIVKKLPPNPGVYQFFNHSGEILYVGKAKSLRNRVSSYFTSQEAHNFKLKALVNKIHDIKYILVENESDALLLENNLIKEYQPRYNILLKDDKTYPWICIKKERFPRVMVTRNYLQDGSEYFGPYTSGIMVKTLLELIRQLFKLRTCNYLLSPTNIEKGKLKRCLEFQLGNCLAPCEGLQREDEYNQSIQQVQDILKGNFHTVVKQLRSMMDQYARQLKFEEAAIVKNKIEIFDRFKGKSTIVNPKMKDIDVFSILDEEDYSYINFLKIVNGAIIQAHNMEVIKRLSEDKKEVLGTVIFDLRQRFNSHSKEIIVPFLPDISPDQVHFIVPIKGDKKQLLELSFRNAASFKGDKLASRIKDKWANKEEKSLLKLQEDLKMKSLPVQIECFDNSNLQGTNPVASCVVFISGKPKKSAYRHFNIKTVVGPNDYASMEEIVLRRYKRLLEDGERLPDLIIIDGGKGQLHAAVKSLKELNLYGKIAIISIAKRLEEIFMPEDPIPLYIDKTSTSLRLIQRIRDEAHRFGITFHRQKRGISLMKSGFTDIKGIGSVTRDKLLKAGINLESLKEIKTEDLTKLVGARATGILTAYLNNLVTNR